MLNSKLAGQIIFMINLFDDLVKQMKEAKHSRQIGRFIAVAILIIGLLLLVGKEIL